MTLLILSAHIVSLEATKPCFKRRSVLNYNNKFGDILRRVVFRNGKLETYVFSQKKTLILLFIIPKTTLLFISLHAAYTVNIIKLSLGRENLLN